MKHHVPRSPLATALSGSAKEVELRIRNIVQGPKKRPSTWFLALVFLSILSCGNLVGCQPVEKSEPDPSDHASSPDFVSTSEPPAKPLLSLAYGDGTFYLMEEDPRPGQEPVTDTVAVLYYDSPTLGLREITVLDYGPGHPYWSAVSLEPFTDVLGYDGIVFGHDVGTAWHSIDYYAVTDEGVFLMAPCYNDVWQQDLDGDGEQELLSNYHNMGYLDMYQRQSDGQIVCYQLNSTAWRVLHGVPAGTWVRFSRGKTENELTVSWTDESGEDHTRSAGDPWVFPMAAGISTVEIQAPDTGEDLGTFFLQSDEEPGFTSAWFAPAKAGGQKLFSLDFSHAPAIAIGADNSPLPTLNLEPYTDPSGRRGAVLTYGTFDQQSRICWYVDADGQPVRLTPN